MWGGKGLGGVGRGGGGVGVGGFLRPPPPPPPTISKKTDRQIACSRLQHSAEKSDAKNARGLERVGSRSRASYFPLACQSHFRDVPTICKLTDRQTDRHYFNTEFLQLSFLDLQRGRSLQPLSRQAQDRSVTDNFNLFAFLCFRRNCPICRHPLFSQDSQ